MWADVIKDGSVLMGISGEVVPSIEKIFDPKGELLPGKHFEIPNEKESVSSTKKKISFHTSGRYKLMQKIKKLTTDRVTVAGLPLKDIVKLTRMLDILIPSHLTKSICEPVPNKDMIIDISNFPKKPLRCTISCMPIKELNNINSRSFVDTSLVESTFIYGYDNLAWIWTIRVSRNDEDETAHPTKFYVLLHGKVIWPSLFKKLANKFNKLKIFFRKLLLN